MQPKSCLAIDQGAPSVKCWKQPGTLKTCVITTLLMSISGCVPAKKTCLTPSQQQSGHLYLSGVWLDVDLRKDTEKTCA